MDNKKQVKTVRFNSDELTKIEAFLKKNPGMDLSTLIRISINSFINNPKLNNLQDVKIEQESTAWN
jgi:hypothetical protein